MVAISNPNCVGCAFFLARQFANLAKFCRYYSRFCGRCRQNAIDNLPKWGVITYLHKSFNDGQKWQTGRKFDDVWVRWGGFCLWIGVLKASGFLLLDRSLKANGFFVCG